MQVFLSVVISPVCSILLLRAAFAARWLLSPISNSVGKQRENSKRRCLPFTAAFSFTLNE